LRHRNVYRDFVTVGPRLHRRGTDLEAARGTTGRILEDRCRDTSNRYSASALTGEILGNVDSDRATARSRTP